MALLSRIFPSSYGSSDHHGNHHKHLHILLPPSGKERDSSNQSQDISVDLIEEGRSPGRSLLQWPEFQASVSSS